MQINYHVLVLKESLRLFKNYNIIIGDLSCPEKQSLEMEPLLIKRRSQPIFCIPDDEWESISNQTTPKIVFPLIN